MTFRVSKYTHNAWKAPQQHKNPQILFMKRISYKHFILVSLSLGSLVLSFRFLAKKLVEENVLIQERVKFILFLNI